MHPARPGKTGLPGTALAFVLGGFLALVAAAEPAGATTLMLNGTTDLSDRSDAIVTGTVKSVEARMHPEHQFIYTYVTIEVDEVFKGSGQLSGRSIVLEELGGQVDRWIHHVESVPRYEEGERVLSFLEDREGDLFRTYGWIQGKFSFELDRQGGEVLTRPAEWNETVLAVGNVSDLTPMRADGSYPAAPLLDAIRDRVAGN